MHRINLLAAAIMFMCLLPIRALAQDMVLPGPGEIRELRSDDSRCPEGYRCFVVGSYVRGAQLSPDTLLERVNRDIEDASRHISMAQFEAANPCTVLYVRGHSGEQRFAKNGVCESYNHSRERVTYSEFCSGASRCGRWLVASSPRYQTVYRVPAERHLTPSERAEEMVSTLDGTNVSESGTVPAPAQLGQWLTEFHDLMDEDQPPTYEEARNVIGAIGRTLTRASGETVSEDSGAADPNGIHSTPVARRALDDSSSSGREAEPSGASLTTDGSGYQQTSSSDQASPGPNPYLMLILGILGTAGVAFLVFFLILRRRDLRTVRSEFELTEAVQTALNQRDDQAKLNAVLRDCWDEYSRGLSHSLALTPEHLRNTFHLVKHYLALGAVWNGRGELGEASLKDVCEKADKLGALEAEWKKRFDATPLNTFELAKLPKRIRGDVEQEFDTKIASLEQEVQAAKNSSDELERQQRANIEALHEEIRIGKEQIASAENGRERALHALEAFREEALTRLGEFILPARHVLEELDPYIEEPEACHDLTHFRSVYDFIRGLHKQATSFVKPMEEFFERLAGDRVPGIIPVFASAVPDGTQAFFDPELVRQTEGSEELSLQSTAVSIAPLPRGGTHPYVKAGGDNGGGAISDAEPTKVFRLADLNQDRARRPRTPTIPIGAPPPSIDAPGDQDNEE